MTATPTPTSRVTIRALPPERGPRPGAVLACGCSCCCCCCLHTLGGLAGAAVAGAGSKRAAMHLAVEGGLGSAALDPVRDAVSGYWRWCGYLALAVVAISALFSPNAETALLAGGLVLALCFPLGQWLVSAIAIVRARQDAGARKAMVWVLGASFLGAGAGLLVMLGIGGALR